MNHVKAACALACLLALGLPACELPGARPEPTPSPSPSPTPAPGTRWEPLGSPGEIADLQFVSAQVAWAAGGGGLIRKSEDGGRTWAAPKAEPSTFNRNVSDFATVSFVDPRFGFLGGSFGLFKTEDGGDSWTPVAPFFHDNGPPPYGNQVLVRFRDYEHGVVVHGGELHRTTDGGKTWAKTPLGLGAYRAIGMIGAEFAVLTDANLWVSKPDGGWGEILLPTAYKEGLHNDPYGAFHFLDAQHGWVFHKGTLHRTVDGGENWTEQVPDHRGGEGSVVRFIDPARGWVIGKGYFKATRTGGATWEDVPHLQNFHQDRDRSRGIQILDAANVYVYGGSWGLRRWVAP